MNFEQKIITGIANNIIKPSEVTLSVTNFDDNDCARLFAASQKLEVDNLPIDIEGLFTFATNTAAGDFWANKQDFQLSSTLSKSNVYHAISEVRKQASRNALVGVIRSLAETIEETKTSQIIGKLKNALLEAEHLSNDLANGFVFVADIVEQQRQIYQELHDGEFYAVPTFFRQLDNLLLDGFSKGDLHLIAGMSGQGKSALMLNFANHQANNGYCVGVISLEMSQTENLMRIQSALTQVPRWHIRRNLHQTDLDTLNENLNQVAKLKIAFNTATSDIYSLPGQVREMVEKHGLDILYVDYAQLMSANQDAQSKAQEVSKISRTLKLIAMENNIPVVALTQFAKSAINAPLFELSDHFKESSSLKQDCSTATVVQLEQTEEIKQIKKAKLVVLKNRNGATFQPIEMDYRGEIFQFSEQKEEYDNYADR